MKCLTAKRNWISVFMAATMLLMGICFASLRTDLRTNCQAPFHATYDLLKSAVYSQNEFITLEKNFDSEVLQREAQNVRSIGLVPFLPVYLPDKSRHFSWILGIYMGACPGQWSHIIRYIHQKDGEKDRTPL